jgi:hypothetical protein
MESLFSTSTFSTVSLGSSTYSSGDRLLNKQEDKNKEKEIPISFKCSVPYEKPLDPEVIQKSKKIPSFMMPNYRAVYNMVDLPFEKNTSNLKPGVMKTNIAPSLIFDSKFESGNLESAYRVGSTNEYILFLANDDGKPNTLWFYFKVILTALTQ